jgi:3-keto-disaccharide hydrolase
MLTVSLILAAALAAQEPPKMPAGDGFVGKWNVKITDATDTFASGGFQISKKDGGLVAGVVWRWGSYLPAKSAELKDGTLVIVREETKGKPDTFEARLEGDVLKGKVTYADGKVHHFEGKRAPLLLSKKAPVWGEPVTLFDGKTLDGWKLRDAKKKNGWAAANGELVVVDPKDNSDLVSERTFQDLKLHIEFNVDRKSNSGVYLRGRYEIQILDNPDAKMALDPHGCGGVYSRIAPKVDATKPAGQWQTYDITMVGRQVTVVLNGQTIVQGVVDGITGGALSPWEDEPGPLMLQGDHGKVRFRNVVVTPAQ